MQIFSSAFVSEETGDVGGFDLVLNRHAGASVDGLLYVYEGAANDDGIPLSGQLSDKNLTMTGNWVEHLVEYPSKKEIVQTHVVEIGGRLDSASFYGTIEIEGIVSLTKTRLKRVEQIWVCRPNHKKR